MSGRKPHRFDDVAMLPQEGDTAALAKRTLPRGSEISLGGSDDGRTVVTLTSPCLEGHRFAVRRVPPGGALLSWGLPFGHALEGRSDAKGGGGIAPGDVLMNVAMAEALRGRLSGPHEESDAIRELLETRPVNFEDLDVSPDHPFRIEEHGFSAVGPNRPKGGEDGSEATTFPGYQRLHGRGVGTRNHVIVLALTASSSPFVAPLANRWLHQEECSPSNFDGVRVVAHTEGESDEKEQHNIDHIHRCLAGFLTHPNVGAAVVVTTGRERHVTMDTLTRFVETCNAEADSRGKPRVYPLECFEEPFLRQVRIRGDPDDVLSVLDAAVRDAVSCATVGVSRQPCPLSNLNLALQCGGSDAFSGLTGNPLAGEVAAELITKFAARAILGESPELVGAEPYILSRVSDEGVARRFVATTERYKAYAARHGQSAAGNPSGGNLYRGIYNIVLKSLGAARKKPPSTSLDCVLEYGEPMRDRSDDALYAFMDSPGNDLESIAGQVASGCNVVVFITGNGSLTNFPFVPTIKVVTTTRRYEVLEQEMDVDAGPYGHGGDDRRSAVNDAVDLCVRVASGERSKGEAAGHSQVSIWRNWAVASENGEGVATKAAASVSVRKPMQDETLRLCSRQEPHAIRSDPPPLPDSLIRQPPVQRSVYRFETGSTRTTPFRPWRVGASSALVPTSLCSSQIALSIRDYTMSKDASASSVYIVCPSHTEGCGAGGDAAYERTYQRLMLGHALHPSVGRALFLEHGCEKTHNDYFRNCLRETGAIDDNDASDLSRVFGFWSIQSGGGFENAKTSVCDYFLSGSRPESSEGFFGLPWSSRPISVGFLVDADAVDADGRLLASSIATVVRMLSKLHVNSVLPSNSPLVERGSESCVATASDAGTSKTEEHGDGISRSPTATGDIEDFFSTRHQKPKQKRRVDSSVGTVFASEALLDGAIPSPTLMPGQMIDQHSSGEEAGLHVMDLPPGATWNETVSCLGPSCDAMLLVARPGDVSTLPGSCLSPTVRHAAPSEAGDDAQTWRRWTEDACAKLIEVLRSPLVCGGDAARNPEDVSRMRRSLFSLTTFVVPRGNAVSL